MRFNKLLGITLALLCLGTLASCGGDKPSTSSTTTAPTTTTAQPTTTSSKPASTSTTTSAPTTTVTQTTTTVASVMSYDEYVAAQNGTEVIIEAYVQGKQGWWQNKATIYLQDDNGGYFVYELPCTEEQYNTDLVIGNKIKVTGIKGEWSGQVEILGSEAGAEATYELLTGTKVYDAKAMTSFDKESLLAVLNQKVSFAELTVTKVELPTKDGGDIYFDVTNGEYTYTFCVESYLTDSSTEVYKTVLALKANDVISCEGFMYCYENPQLHTTNVVVAQK